MKGFQTFLPLYAKARRWKDRIKLIHFPLFPCYVFLHTAAGSDFSGRKLNIISTPGVHKFVSNAGQPVVIPSDEVESIRRAAESGATIEPHSILKSPRRCRQKLLRRQPA
jgi:transcription antitermination factor NusG